MTETRSKVFVTEPEYRKASESYEAFEMACVPAPEDEEALASRLRAAQARYVVVGNRKYSGPLYDALPAGGVVARMGVGHDGVDKQRATEAGVLCTNTPGVLDESVAEHTMLLIAAAARRLIPALANMTSGAWKAPAGRDLHGKTLAIVGCGGIGRALARIAALGYGMKVVGCSRPGATARTIDHFEFVTDDFSAAVRDADFVSVHIPANPENTRFINRDRLGCLDRKAWLINTARGAVVDEAALFEFLAAGNLAGAALDVFAVEPYVPAEGSGDLRSLPNVILTPHVGSNTVEANRRMAERALQNISLAEAREFARMDLLNREALSHHFPPIAT
jgi:lactate dehydrogenase-like 2-hydroxyacid dehydrogenase